MIDGALIDSKSTDFDMVHHQLIKKIHMQITSPRNGEASPQIVTVAEAV